MSLQQKQHKYQSPRSKENKSKIKSNLYTIIFNRIEPLGYHVLDYYIRLQIQGQSWESPIVQGGQYEQINIKSSIRKASKLYEQHQQVKNKKTKKWIVQAKGGDQISGVLKFIEKNQEKQKFKGKAKISIQNSGIFQLFIYDDIQVKQQKNSKNSIVFQKDIQKSARRENNGKRIACIQYEVIKNEKKKDQFQNNQLQLQSKILLNQQNFGNIFSKFSSQPQQINQRKQKLTKQQKQQKSNAKLKLSKIKGASDTQQQRFAYNRSMIEQQSSLSYSGVSQIKNKDRKNEFNLQNSIIQKINQKYSDEDDQNNKFQRSLVNQLVNLNKSLQENLQAQRDQQQMYSRMLQQDTMILQMIKGGNGKASKNHIQEQAMLSKRFEKKQPNKNFQFKGRRNNFSENPQNAYQSKLNKQEQQNFKTSLKEGQGNISFQKSSLISQSPRQKLNLPSKKQQTVKSLATLSDFILQCEVKPNSLQLFYRNNLNCDETILLKNKSKHSHQYAWQSQVQVQFDLPENIQLRARVHGSLKQVFQGNINVKDSNDCAFLYKVNTRQNETKQLMLLKYRKKAMKLIETKYHQLIQMPQSDKKKQNQKNKERNKIGKIQQEQQQSSQQQIHNQNENNNKQELPKNSTDISQKGYLVQQKIELVKSMFQIGVSAKKESKKENKNQMSRNSKEYQKYQRPPKINVKQFTQKKQNANLSNRKQEQSKKSIQPQKRKQSQDVKLNPKQKWVKDSQQEQLGESQIGVSQPSSPNLFLKSKNNLKVKQNMKTIQQQSKQLVFRLDNAQPIKKQYLHHKIQKQSTMPVSKLNIKKNTERNDSKSYSNSKIQLSRSKTDNPQANNADYIKDFIQESQVSKITPRKQYTTPRKQQKMYSEIQQLENISSRKQNNQNKTLLSQFPKTFIIPPIKEKKLTMVTRAIHDNIIPQQIYSYYISKKQKQKKIIMKSGSKPASKQSNQINSDNIIKDGQNIVKRRNNLSRSHFINQNQNSSLSDTKNRNSPPLINENKLKDKGQNMRRNIILNMQKFTQSEATVSNNNLAYNKNHLNNTPKNNSNGIIQKYGSNNKTISHDQMKKTYFQTQILIHLIHINLNQNNPLTGKFITMEVYPQQPYQTQTLTCNNRLIWRGKGYSFKVFTSQISYEQQISLIIKLYEQTSKSKSIVGKLVIPLPLLLQSGQVYNGKINGIDFQPIGDISLQFKVFHHTDPFENMPKIDYKPGKIKLKKKKQYLQNDLEQIGKISKKIQHIFQKYIPAKKRSKTLDSSHIQKLDESNVQFMRNLRNSSQINRQKKPYNRNNVHTRRNTQNNTDLSPQKYDEYFNDPTFVKKLLQLKKRCRHLTHENCKGCQNEQNQRNVIRAHKKKFKVKKIVKMQESSAQKKDISKVVPKIELIKQKKKYLAQED